MGCQKIELLSPAKNFECAVAAISHGADAVYIGGPSFGARAAAGNSLQDIEQLVRYAHFYGAKVYITLNTILTDRELEQAARQIQHYYDMGVNALIIQDMGLLQLDLPPIPLHASTQMDNRSVDKVKFLYQNGFERVVLARELSLQQIAEIHRECPVELEAFVHGALCVSYSGRCYMSFAGCGRSANRGECAQYCRLPYDLYNADDELVVKSKHLLSLKDMDRSDFLLPMMQAGVCSFKIEGRLKDVSYVKNITAYYRKKLDLFLNGHDEYMPASYGTTRFFFEPNPEKTFHRGKTDYFIEGRKTGMAQLYTPKSVGEFVGTVCSVRNRSFDIDSTCELHNGDGLCYVDKSGAFAGFRVNKVDGKRVFITDSVDLYESCRLYRNYDVEFDKVLKGKTAERKIRIRISVDETPAGLCLSCQDEVGRTVSLPVDIDKVKAEKEEQALTNLKTNLGKWGSTDFEVEGITVNTKDGYFIPNSIVSEWRRSLADMLQEEVKKEFLPNTDNHVENVVISRKIVARDIVPEPVNVFNEQARNLYEQCQVTEVPYAFERTLSPEQPLMQCRHCIKFTLGYCPKYKNEEYRQLCSGAEWKEPLYMRHGGKRYRLQFDCRHCKMLIWTQTD